MKAILLIGLSVLAAPVFAASYTYDISGWDGGSRDFVTTNCDNCKLTSADILSWSLSQNVVPGPLFSNSSMSQSSVHVDGAGFVAKPTGLWFDFNRNDPYDSVMFKSGGNSVQFTDSPDFLAYATGATNYCSQKVNACWGNTVSGNQELGKLQPASAKQTSAPELNATGFGSMLTLLLGLLALSAGRSRAALRPALQGQKR